MCQRRIRKIVVRGGFLKVRQVFDLVTVSKNFFLVAKNERKIQYLKKEVLKFLIILGEEIKKIF